MPHNLASVGIVNLMWRIPFPVALSLLKEGSSMKSSAISALRRKALVIGMLGYVVMGLFMLIGTQAATSGAQVFMMLGSISLPMVGYVVAACFHEGKGGILMIAGAVPLAALTLQPEGGGGLMNALIFIAPFVVAGILFLFHYIAKNQGDTLPGSPS